MAGLPSLLATALVLVALLLAPSPGASSTHDRPLSPDPRSPAGNNLSSSEWNNISSDQVPAGCQPTGHGWQNVSFQARAWNGRPPYRFDWYFGDGGRPETARGPNASTVWTSSQPGGSPPGGWVELNVTDSRGMGVSTWFYVPGLDSPLVCVTTPQLYLEVGIAAAAFAAAVVVIDRVRRRRRSPPSGSTQGPPTVPSPPGP